ncbi:ankyrin repeat and MYND domain-containing protein 1 [Menidia menidia]
MLTSTCGGVRAAVRLRGGLEPGSEGRSTGHHGALVGVQEWPDGSRYEGELVNGLKHGKGRYRWKNGEYYEGYFYKDYKHGDGLYCWPTGHKFIGKFYLNRKEGYGQQMFPDGATFQGLYHTNQRFGPGVVTYPDGRQDVGLWLKERLLRLCTPVEVGFSVNNFPEYDAYIEPSVSTDFLDQPQSLSSGLHTKNNSSIKMPIDGDLLSDESFIIPPGMESYSTDGDHLPLPPGRRRELDQHFYGELWDPDSHSHQGYERDPLSALPLQARMQAHIHNNRLQAETVDWDVAAVLSLNRERFGPKGPLEVSSELMIQHSSLGELQAVAQILQTGLVHPDVADSRGNTAIIAATVNCHDDVIHMLLDRGADIDKLSSEGMSALAICHVLYYPFQSLHTTLFEPPSKSRALTPPSSCEDSPQISKVDLISITPLPDTELQTSVTSVKAQSNVSLQSESSKELTEHIINHDSKAFEIPSEIDDSNIVQGEDERESKCNERQEGSRYAQAVEREERGDKDMKSEKAESNGEDAESVEKNRIESTKDQMVGEEQFEENMKSTNKREDRSGTLEIPCLEHSIETLDGHGAQLKEIGVKATGREEESHNLVIHRTSPDLINPVWQGEEKGANPKQNFDSTCSASSYKIQVSEEAMQHSSEAPSGTETAHQESKVIAVKTDVRLKTLKLLLDRGADPNMARIPMPVLFFAIMAADAPAVQRLLLSGARTDIPLPAKKRGLYPLHVAADLPGPAGPRITELLLHCATDPDVRACDQDEIYEPDKISIMGKETLSNSKRINPKEGGQTALHVACRRDHDHQNASKVVALLLSHRASTDLLWSGHSPLSLAIASGNELAVEELLNGGADPNIQLGARVHNALCALVNINYCSGADRIRMLDMLDKAGADVSMPVTVGSVAGSVVDYAHYSFSQDFCMANAHASIKREKETRRQLLSMMGDLLRRTHGQKVKENLERQQHLTRKSAGANSANGPLPSCDGLPEQTENDMTEEFQFCYHCGRSVFVKLTPCSRCHKVSYCSKACKRKAWEERHKEECFRVLSGKQNFSLPQPLPNKPKQHQPPKLNPEAPADDIPKKVAYISKQTHRPLTIMKPKTLPPLLSAAFKSQRGPKPLGKTEKFLEIQVNLKENYSYN